MASAKLRYSSFRWLLLVRLLLQQQQQQLKIQSNNEEMPLRNSRLTVMMTSSFADGPPIANQTNTKFTVAASAVLSVEVGRTSATINGVHDKQNAIRMKNATGKL